MAIDPEIKREIDDLKRGNTTRISTFSLTPGAATTSTTITRSGTSSGDLVQYMALSSLAVQSDIVRIVPAKGSFVVTHSASTNVRTYRYLVITNAAG